MGKRSSDGWPHGFSRASLLYIQDHRRASAVRLPGFYVFSSRASHRIYSFLTTVVVAPLRCIGVGSRHIPQQRRQLAGAVETQTIRRASRPSSLPPRAPQRAPAEAAAVATAEI